jgi:hypothetical protein
MTVFNVYGKNCSCINLPDIVINAAGSFPGKKKKESAAITAGPAGFLSMKIRFPWRVSFASIQKMRS